MKKSLSLRAARSLFCALALVFILLSAVSFFSSCHLDKSEPLHYVYEFVVYAWDPLFLNSLLLCSLLLVFLFSYPQLLKLRLFPLSACVILAHVLFAVIWFSPHRLSPTRIPWSCSSPRSGLRKGITRSFPPLPRTCVSFLISWAIPPSSGLLCASFMKMPYSRCKC